MKSMKHEGRSIESVNQWMKNSAIDEHSVVMDEVSLFHGINPEVKARKSRWVIERRDADPSYKMAMNVSRCVRMGIKKGNGVKEYSTWKALPYTPQQLREHIENQFEEWMSWDNYGTGEGKWNIDHIIPQSKLRYDSLDHPNFQKCWALENLRPICSIENIRKSNK